jgi:DNA repair protein RadC
MSELIDKVRHKGIETISDYDLLALIVKESEDEYFTKTRLGETLDMTKNAVNDLLAVPGIDERKACAVIAAFELGRRYHGGMLKKVKTAADAFPIVAHYSDRKQEHFIVMSLNGAHEVLAVRVVSIGLLDRTIVHPREIFADPLSDRAAAIIVAHNHPSGQLEPSEEDQKITLRLVEAGKLLGIPLLDHIIIGRDGGYFSFVESGMAMAF